MGMAAKLVKKALGVHNSQTDDNKREKVLKKRSSAEQIQQPVSQIWEHHLTICVSYWHFCLAEKLLYTISAANLLVCSLFSISPL